MVLRVIFAVVPVVLLVLGLYIALKYALTPKVHDELKTHLARRRGSKIFTAELAAEEGRLKNMLV
jgi:Na+/melibiose symporter-like transporter